MRCAMLTLLLCLVTACDDGHIDLGEYEDGGTPDSDDGDGGDDGNNGDGGNGGDDGDDSDDGNDDTGSRP